MVGGIINIMLYKPAFEICRGCEDFI